MTTRLQAIKQRLAESQRLQDMSDDFLEHAEDDITLLLKLADAVMGWLDDETQGALSGDVGFDRITTAMSRLQEPAE